MVCLDNFIIKEGKIVHSGHNDNIEKNRDDRYMRGLWCMFPHRYVSVG